MDELLLGFRFFIYFFNWDSCCGCIKNSFI